MPVPVNKATLTRIRELKVALDLAAAVHEKTEKVVSDLQAALDALARRLDELATKERTLVAELIECKEQLAQKTAECELLARDRARSVLASQCPHDRRRVPPGYCRTSTCECPDTCECKK